MKKVVLGFLWVVFLASTAHGQKPILINSHLRQWTSSIVENHIKLGADIVEIDIFRLDEPELQKSLDVLGRHPGKSIALHLKGIGVDQLPQIEVLFEQNKHLWPQLWFFSGNSAMDAHIRSKYPLAYVSRSTKQNVMSCLKDGLNDEFTFVANCIEKDLWVRPAMMKNQLERAQMKSLIEKIRAYEASQPVVPSLVALDQIDSVETYCDFVPEFSKLVDGIVSENFDAIVELSRGQRLCP